MMRLRIKALWVAALRSGAILQGRARLRDRADEMCCLGVLCNLHACAHPAIAARQLDPTVYLGCVSFLPPEVVRWAGLESVNPSVLIGGRRLQLSMHNDGTRLLPRRTFAEIADAIEGQL